MSQQPTLEAGLRCAGDITHRKSAEDLGKFWKSKLVELRIGHWTKRLAFACSRGLRQVSHKMGGGVQMKRPEYKDCASLSLCRKTFKLKGNKKFRTWTEKSLRVFRILRFLCSMYICYEHPMYISHIHVYGYEKFARKCTYERMEFTLVCNDSVV